MKQRLDFPNTVKREVASWSNWKCMICHISVPKAGEPEVAHIVPASKDGPRKEYYEQYPASFIKSRDNALLVCSSCHNKIDKTDEYSIEKLFSYNRKYKADFEIESMIGQEIFNLNKINDIEKAVENLRCYLNLSKQEIDQEVAKMFETEIMQRIDLEDKIVLNQFDIEISDSIKATIEYQGVKIYSALSSQTSELGFHYLISTFRMLYLKFSSYENEAKKYKKMKQVLKSCCRDLSIDETGLLNYYFCICEVFKK